MSDHSAEEGMWDNIHDTAAAADLNDETEEMSSGGGADPEQENAKQARARRRKSSRRKASRPIQTVVKKEKMRPKPVTVKQETALAIKPTDAAGTKKRRYADKTWMHCRRQQGNVNTVIPRACFLRMVREMISERGGCTDDGVPLLRVKKDAVDMLHAVAEDLVIGIAAEANSFAERSKRITPTQADVYNAVYTYLRVRGRLPPPHLQQTSARYQYHTKPARLHVARQTVEAARFMESEGLLEEQEGTHAHKLYLKARSASRAKEQRRHAVKAEKL